MMDPLLYRLFWIILLFPCTSGAEADECESIQFLELGSNATLRCSFGIDFYSVIWYDSEDYITTKPIVVLQDQNIIDDGGLSRDYDIRLDGSLIIHEVSLTHEHTFLAVKFDRKESKQSFHYIDVIVTVTPSPDFPVIDICGNKSFLCFKEANPSDVITCSVKKARPKLNLEWEIRTDIGDNYIASQTKLIINHEVSSSSYSTLHVGFLNSTSLSLLVCKASYTNGLLAKNESEILVQYGSINYASVQQENIFVERNMKLSLKCGHNNIKYLVWKKLSKKYVTQDYAVANLVGESIHTTNSNNFDLVERGSLTINQTKIYDEGIYACTFSDGTFQDTSLYNVMVYVNPNPLYPVVDGCSEEKYCIIEINRVGSLSCSLIGIRPIVDLTFRTLYKSDMKKISFFEEKIKIITDEETFDVVLTTKYELYDSSDSRLTLECKTHETEGTALDWSKKFDLIFISDTVIFTESAINTNQHTHTDSAHDQALSFFIILMVATGSVLLCITLLICVCYQVVRGRRQKSPSGTNNEEMESMLPDEKLSSKKSIFLTELRTHYENLCQTVYPIPFMKEKVFGVNDLYVEGGIELSMVGTRGHKVWKSLKSYRDILNDNIIRSQICVVIGDPGYGKSTLGIQLVYDWWKRVSPLANIDFVIFIRFRQLGTIKTLFEAIKLFLLPTDSQLTVNDVETIIRGSKSTLIIFDGYDEIDDRSQYLKSDIKHILTRNMLQNVHIIVTSRTFCFPKEVAPSTACIRLSGFDNEAREKYIKKAIVADDAEAAEDIIQRLEQNPIHGDICEIPLFFVMYAHISYVRGVDMKFDSVTSFFQYMISCFHNHLRNKYSDDDNSQSILFETDHNDLDEVAFMGLSEEQNKIVWSREELLSKLGNNFYENYLRIGILVEEEILSFIIEPGTLSSEVIQRNTVVRFFHKLACEWYAAHFLAKRVKSLSASALRVTLKKLDPFNLQYVYRFACGINSDAAELIIQYLNTIKDGEKLAILCILEKSGNVENIKETVKEMCVETIYISDENSRLLQRSTMQLIDIASRVQIPIKCINLEKCFGSVDHSKKVITLSSGLHLRSLSMVTELKITEIGREMTQEEVTDIFKYSIICQGLKQLTFECCLLPENSAQNLFGELKISELIVLWNPTAKWYNLGQTGIWEEQDNGRAMTHEGYQEEVKQFRLEWSDMPWQMGNISSEYSQKPFTSM